MSSERPYWTTSPSPERIPESRRHRRLLLDGVGVMATLVLVVGGGLFYRTHQQREALIERAAAEVRRVELELKYRAAARLPGLNGHGWPESIERDWFKGPSGVPINPLVSPERPWLDMASADERDMDNPVVKMTADPRLAGFWYNPRLGVIRARVPVMVSDGETLELYNRVNGTRLASIFDSHGHHSSDEPGEAVESSGARKSAAVEITTTGQVLRRGDD